MLTLTKSITRTYNLGNFENYKPTYSITKEYEEADIINIKEEYNKMTTIIQEMLQNEKNRIDWIQKWK